MSDATEKVLCIPRRYAEAYLGEIFKDGTDETRYFGSSVKVRLESILNRGMFLWLPRNDDLEGNESMLQVIPYVSVVSKGMVFMYKRAGETSEKRLKDLWSIGIGGHVNDSDVAERGESPEETLLNNVKRELGEEMGKTAYAEFLAPSLCNLLSGRQGSEPFLSTRCEGVIFGGKRHVDQVHIGLHIVIEVSKLFTPIQDGEFVANGTISNWTPFAPKPDSGIQELATLESWSTVCFSALSQR